MTSNGAANAKFSLLRTLVILLSGITSYYVAVTFGVMPAPRITYWKQLFTRRKPHDVDGHRMLCNVHDTKDCTDKEKKYIVKMKGKTNIEIQKQFTRLNGMKDEAMSASLKSWLHQRLNILRGLGATEMKAWRVCTAEDTADCSHKEKVYIEKMKNKKLVEIEREYARLNSMTGDAMSTDLKNWLHQRLRILDGLRKAEAVKNEMKLSWRRMITQWLYQRLGMREQPPVNNNDVGKPWTVKEKEYPKKDSEKKGEQEEPTMEVKETEKTLEESSTEETTTSATSDGEEELLEL